MDIYQYFGFSYGLTAVISFLLVGVIVLTNKILGLFTNNN
ncbi:MAG: hypothetical protein K0R55_266 [Sporomusa sp.]|nr:hypothetical protein [Sporomusa sp.]